MQIFYQKKNMKWIIDGWLENKYTDVHMSCFMILYKNIDCNEMSI